MRYIIAFLLLLLSTPAYAGTVSNVSGVVSDDNTITITGASFGTRGDYGGAKSYMCKRYHDFENNLRDDSFFTVLSDRDSDWSLESSSYDGTQWAKRFYGEHDPADRNAALELTMSSSDTTGVYYVCFWYKQSYTETGLINKIFRMFCNTLGHNGDALGYVYGCDSVNDYYIWHIVENDIPTQPQPTRYGNFGYTYTGTPPNALSTTQWRFHEILVDSPNSTVSVYIDGVEASTITAWDINPFDTNGRTLDIGSQIGYGNGSSYLAYDNYYVDYTQARIMLGNASTFAASTHREILLPTAWGASSITATVKTGSFTAGQSAYIFVIDSSGNASNGYSVTIGGGTATDQYISSMTSGTLSDGNSVSFSGSGFGTKSTAAPIKWDKFEDGTNATLLEATDANWVGYLGNDGALYSNTTAHSGSLSVYNDPINRNHFYTNYYTYTPASDEIFVSYWFKIDNADAGDYGVVKLTRLNASSGGGVYNGAGDTILSNMQPQQYPDGDPEFWYNNGEGGDNAIRVGYVDVPYNTWCHIQMYKKLSTAGMANGSLFAKTIGGAYSQSRTNVMTRASGQTWQMDTCWLGLSSANATGSYQLYIDDVYLDNTQARIEIGNASSYSACTHTEIQIPSAWSSTAVTFTVNAGTFGGSDSAYLYVIDSDGNVSDQNGSLEGAQGFPVTFSGSAGADTTPPTLSGKYPANGATNVSITSGLIYWYLSDASGVSDNSVVCTVESTDVSEFISFSGASTYRRCEIDITSLAAWTNSQEINVTVDASDVNANDMTQEAWSFTTLAASGGGSSSGNSISIGSGTINLGGGRITL